MTGNIPSSSNDKKVKNTMIKYLEDNIDELPDSDISKAATGVFDKIDHGKSGVLPSSTFFNCLKYLGGGFIVSR